MSLFSKPAARARPTTRRNLLSSAAALLLLCSAVGAPLAQDVSETTTFDLNAATILDIQAAFDAGALTAEELVKMYLARIALYDDHGPALNAIITINPDALEIARALDEERAQQGPRSPVHGIPMLFKDNYDTFDMPTTGGSDVLAGSVPPDDAYTVEQLRAAGAIILGKANLSEFATPAGRGAYSSINDVTKNPFRLESDPAGSSGGSGASIAANFATIAFGTDTGGSIRGPAAANGVVGIRPTYGLISRDGIIPQALSLDTAGPLARNVTDAAIVLSIMAGSDPNDATTALGMEHAADYTQFLDLEALAGARIGVVQNFFGGDPEVDGLVNAAVAEMQALGAEAVEVSFDPAFLDTFGGLRDIINSEFGPYLEDYLATLADGYPKTLAEVVALYESPEIMDSPTPINPGLIETHKTNLEIAGLEGEDYLRVINTVLPEIQATVVAFMDTHDLDALVWPTARCTASARWNLTDPDRVCQSGPGGNSVGSYGHVPDLQVPVGYTSRGLPVTISFVGRPFSEPTLIGFAYAYEQATMHRILPPLFPALPGEVFEY